MRTRANGSGVPARCRSNPRAAGRQAPHECRSACLSPRSGPSSGPAADGALLHATGAAMSPWPVRRSEPPAILCPMRRLQGPSRRSLGPRHANGSYGRTCANTAPKAGPPRSCPWTIDNLARSQKPANCHGPKIEHKTDHHGPKIEHKTDHCPTVSLFYTSAPRNLISSSPALRCANRRRAVLVSQARISGGVRECPPVLYSPPPSSSLKVKRSLVLNRHRTGNDGN
jgi:hypothetical protein